MESIKTKIIANDQGLLGIIRQNKLTVGLIALILILAIGGFPIFKALTASKTSEQPLQESEITFEADGPYVLLQPRRDGNALILNIVRVSSYDEIAYELPYTSKVDNLGAVSEEGEENTGMIDRGAGNLDTWIPIKGKNEFSQEILFGTCSQGHTSDPKHCVFDKGVENGTLTLRIKKGNIVHRMVMTWHMQQPDIALGKLSSGDGNFTYTSTQSRDKLNLVGYTIINDLTGLPKVPEGKQVFGKVYALNVPPTRTMLPGEVAIVLAENPPSNAKIARFDESKNSWELLDTKIDGGKVTASSSTGGIFSVLIDASK